MDLSRLRPVFEHPGPYVTLQADVGRTTEDAAAQLDAKWTTVLPASMARGGGVSALLRWSEPPA